MSKATVTRLFIGSLIAFGAGAIVAVLAIGIAVANDVFVMAGNDITAIQGGGAGLGPHRGRGRRRSGRGRRRHRRIRRWIGAVLNTSQLESKGWFVGFLLLGIFNFGFIAMIAYVIAGPDGKAAAAARVAPAAAAAGRTRTRWRAKSSTDVGNQGPVVELWGPAPDAGVSSHNRAPASGTAGLPAERPVANLGARPLP